MVQLTLIPDNTTSTNPTSDSAITTTPGPAENWVFPASIPARIKELLIATGDLPTTVVPWLIGPQWPFRLQHKSNPAGYYHVATGHKLNVKYYRLTPKRKGTKDAKGVLVVEGEGDWFSRGPVILGKSPARGAGYYRPWRGLRAADGANVWDDETFEVAKREGNDDVEVNQTEDGVQDEQVKGRSSGSGSGTGRRKSKTAETTKKTMKLATVPEAYEDYDEDGSFAVIAKQKREREAEEAMENDIQNDYGIDDGDIEGPETKKQRLETGDEEDEEDMEVELTWEEMENA
ncbi:uncharacterized protein AB675_5180 [Cyphellophora attinorum]|uniref:Uncharacterized protein n=1 Tax=Cyphellophora attinorum TaxID=1664694 RepID=A0A0N1NZX5_9EURO|nr:uncharacterized protein AB675_5180 [Phialophora attinorum]KPI39336.1 hypothetical protein AB675_5180 [Phialophora attinorum]